MIAIRCDPLTGDKLHHEVATAATRLRQWRYAAATNLCDVGMVHDGDVLVLLFEMLTCPRVPRQTLTRVPLAQRLSVHNGAGKECLRNAGRVISSNIGGIVEPLAFTFPVARPDDPIYSEGTSVMFFRDSSPPSRGIPPDSAKPPRASRKESRDSPTGEGPSKSDM